MHKLTYHCILLDIFTQSIIKKNSLVFFLFLVLSGKTNKPFFSWNKHHWKGVVSPCMFLANNYQLFSSHASPSISNAYHHCFELSVLTANDFPVCDVFEFIISDPFIINLRHCFGRASCIMLNKGRLIVDAVSTLDIILRSKSTKMKAELKPLVLSSHLF